MDIIYSQRFIDEFKDILEFIAKDSLTNSLNFEAELKAKSMRLALCHIVLDKAQK